MLIATTRGPQNHEKYRFSHTRTCFLLGKPKFLMGHVGPLVLCRGRVLLLTYSLFAQLFQGSP